MLGCKSPVDYEKERERGVGREDRKVDESTRRKERELKTCSTKRAGETGQSSIEDQGKKGRKGEEN